MELVTGPNARGPCAKRKSAAGPCCTPQGRALEGGTVPNPEHRSQKHYVFPPRAPSYRPQSAQHQLASACAVGRATGPHARTTRTHRKRAPGSGRTPQGLAVGGGRVPKPGQPSRRQEAPPPPGALLPPAPRAAPARKSVTGRVGYRLRRPHAPCATKQGSGPRLHAPRRGGRGRESVQPWTPLNTIGKQEVGGEDLASLPPQATTSRARDSSRKRGGA